MSTGLASNALAEHFKAPSAAYGASKAAGAHLVRKIHFEHEELTSVILYPGWVKTDLGYSLAKAIGMPEPAVTLEVSCLVNLILRREDCRTKIYHLRWRFDRKKIFSVSTKNDAN